MTSRPRILGIVASPLFVLLLSVPAWAQEEGFAKNGGYLGASSLLNFSFGSENFDGLSYYQKIGGEEILILPQFESAKNVFRAIGGYRSGRGAFEVSYDRAKHQGTF